MDKSGGWASPWLVQGCVKGNVECSGSVGAISVLGGMVMKSFVEDLRKVVLSRVHARQGNTGHQLHTQG